MPDNVRVPGRLGRLPALIPAGLRDLTSYAAGPLPQAPASMPAPAVADWGVLGNDTYGNCGVCGIEHGLMAAAADTGEAEQFPAAQDCVSYYLAYDGGQDNGVVLSQFLAYVRANGYYGHAVQAYAPVAVQDVPTLKFATWAYDFAYLGIRVTQAMMDAFTAGQPWTAATAQGDTLGGHCVPAVGYDDQYLTVVTWGKLQQVAWPAWHAIGEEAWALICGEQAAAKSDGHGLSLAALQADLSRLAVPIPPPPAPAPPAPEGLLAELAAFCRHVAASADRDIADVIAWLRQRGL